MRAPTISLLVIRISHQSVREQTRDSIELKVFLSASDATELQTDPNLRVMVYCAADSGLKQYTKSDIAFPHQVELKANLDEVKANLRGLKNKPGTTQPADVTNYIRKKPNYPNNIVMTYALTQKVGLLVFNLAPQNPSEANLSNGTRLIVPAEILRARQPCQATSSGRARGAAEITQTHFEGPGDPRK